MPHGAGQAESQICARAGGPFASTGVENRYAYLQAALILGHPPWNLPLHGPGVPLHAIAASLEQLAATWAEHYRCFPCLFDEPWPTVGDSRFDTWLSNIWGADGLVAWHDPRGLLQDGVVTKGFFAAVLRSAVVWRCIRQACGGDAHTCASWIPIVIQRARMLAAVLGSVDQWGRRQLVANGFLVAQLPWERFRRGDWWSVCEYTLVNARAPHLGQQAEKDHPRRLAICVARWACETCSCVPQQGPRFQKACDELRSRMDKYLKRGSRR